MQPLKLRANEDEWYMRKSKNKVKTPRTAWEKEVSRQIFSNFNRGSFCSLN